MIRERPVSYIVKTRATKRMPLFRFREPMPPLLMINIRIKLHI